MTAKVLLLLLALVAAAAAEGSHSHEDLYRSHESHESEQHKYEYNYQAKDDNDNDFGHEKNRDGDLTHGSFYNHLPDARQTEKYVADIRYEGEDHYDSASYEPHPREVRESSRPGRSGSRKPRESPFSFLSRHSRHSGESKFRFGFQDSRVSSRPTRESRESKENKGNSRSLESRRHHSPVYYQPMFDSVEYQSRSDESDEDFLTSTAYFIDNYRPQIRYQPS